MKRILQDRGFIPAAKTRTQVEHFIGPQNQKVSLGTSTRRKHQGIDIREEPFKSIVRAYLKNGGKL